MFNMHEYHTVSVRLQGISRITMNGTSTAICYKHAESFSVYAIQILKGL